MSASLDNSVRVWDPRAGPAEIARYTMSAPVRSLALNHEGDCLYFCPNPHDHDWIELRASDRKVVRAAFWHSPVRYASKMALSPFRLETDYAVLGTRGRFTFPNSWLSCFVGGGQVAPSCRLYRCRPRGGALPVQRSCATTPNAATSFLSAAGRGCAGPTPRSSLQVRRAPHTHTICRSGLVLIDVGGR